MKSDQGRLGRRPELIVGLGNPGKKYEGTRHNVGWLVVERLASQMVNGQWLMNKRLQSLIISHQSLIVLAKPTVFMNESGKAVRKLLKHFKVKPANLWVVHDDIDLPLGRVKIKVGGGAAGHHGVESIIEEIGSREFVRIKLGIGRPGRSGKCEMGNAKWEMGSGKWEMRGKVVERFVLEKFAEEEGSVVEKMVERAVEVIKLGLEEGIEKAMARKF